MRRSSLSSSMVADLEACALWVHVRYATHLRHTVRLILDTLRILDTLWVLL
jgi:hypothetical protein